MEYSKIQILSSALNTDESTLPHNSQILIKMLCTAENEVPVCKIASFSKQRRGFLPIIKNVEAS